jgi:hypothetical protein
MRGGKANRERGALGGFARWKRDSKSEERLGLTKARDSTKSPPTMKTKLLFTLAVSSHPFKYTFIFNLCVILYDGLAYSYSCQQIKFICSVISNICNIFGTILKYTNKNKLKEFFSDVLKETVTNWFNVRAAEFFDEGIQKLIPRLNNCLDNNDDYTEK